MTLDTAQVGLLGRFIGVREPNLKYLGLENMVRLAEVPAVMETVSKCVADADTIARHTTRDIVSESRALPYQKHLLLEVVMR